MHPLNDIPAGVKHSSDVLSVNGSGEVGITEVPPVMSFHADFLEMNTAMILSLLCDSKN